MNSSNEYKRWFAFFSNLGSRTVPRTNKKIWMDLEEFVVLGTRYATENSRTFTSFIITCNKVAPILSPFKINKIAKKTLKNTEFNVLGYIISNIQNHTRNPGQWNSLIKLSKKNMYNLETINLFGSKAFKIDTLFQEWNIDSSSLELGEIDKYLNSEKLLTHRLIHQRLSGVKTVFSDISFYRIFHEKTSLNQMAKDIFHDYRSVYQASELLELVA